MNELEKDNPPEPAVSGYAPALRAIMSVGEIAAKVAAISSDKCAYVFRLLTEGPRSEQSLLGNNSDRAIRSAITTLLRKGMIFRGHDGLLFIDPCILRVWGTQMISLSESIDNFALTPWGRTPALLPTKDGFRWGKVEVERFAGNPSCYKSLPNIYKSSPNIQELTHCTLKVVVSPYGVNLYKDGALRYCYELEGDDESTI
jgi:hypothetical protein